VNLLVIENLLKIITSTVVWMFIAQTLLLAAIYFKLRDLSSTRKHSNDNSKEKKNTIKDRIKE